VTHLPEGGQRAAAPAVRAIGAKGFVFRHLAAWFRETSRTRIGAKRARGGKSMQELVVRAQVGWYLATRRLAQLGGERGQGTVEYVGLILLVALLMVGMVAAMKGFQGKQGLELAETIVDKIRSAVNQVNFK
jgi:hypothetical protein